MKKLLLFFLFTMGAATSLFSQDIVVMQSGEEVKAAVEEVGSLVVKYKKFDNPDGPVYAINRADISMIKYANGTKDVFATAQPTPANDYDRKLWGVALLCSYFLPGGGQYYNGQYVKGGIMTGIALVSIGGIIASVASVANKDIGDATHGEEAAFLACVAVYGINYMCSLIDAPVSAMRINRERGFMSWGVGKKSTLSLRPDLQLSSTFGQNVAFAPSYGAKLTLNLR